MADYISREAAIALAKDLVLRYEDGTTYKHRCIDPQCIREIPAADVRPVVRGKWVPYEFGDYHWRKCSVCGVADKYIETVKRDGFADEDIESRRNFCPNCGADMRKTDSSLRSE